MGVDAAALAAALVLWFGGFAAMLRVQRAVGGRIAEAELYDARGWLRTYIREPRVWGWTVVFTVIAAFFTAIDIRRGVLVLYCAALTGVWVGNRVSDNRRLWNESPKPRPRFPRRHVWRAAYWAAYALGTFGWIATSAFAGRLIVDAIGGD
jgi:hypothetical protein